MFLLSAKIIDVLSNTKWKKSQYLTLKKLLKKCPISYSTSHKSKDIPMYCLFNDICLSIYLHGNQWYATESATEPSGQTVRRVAPLQLPPAPASIAYQYNKSYLSVIETVARSLLLAFILLLNADWYLVQCDVDKTIGASPACNFYDGPTVYVCDGASISWLYFVRFFFIDLKK